MNEHPTAKSTPIRDPLSAAVNRIMYWIGSIPSLIAHTIFFVASFCLVLFGFDFNTILLVVTTIVSLEAIYMAIFIQIALNQASQRLEAVQEDIDEIQEDVEEIEKDLDDIQEDVDEIEKDIDEIQKDVDVMEKEDTAEQSHHAEQKVVLEQVESRLVKLLTQLEKMKDGMK